MSMPIEALHGLTNACQLLPTVLTGGQPSVSHLTAFKATGGAIVLDLRDPMEPRPLDEPAVIRSLGLEYVNIPVTPGTMTDDTLDRILGVLRTAGERPVLVHCGSGNRVGAALIPLLMKDHGLEEEDAVGEAMRVGLRSAELMEWAMDYTRRHM